MVFRGNGIAPAEALQQMPPQLLEAQHPPGVLCFQQTPGVIQTFLLENNLVVFQYWLMTSNDHLLFSQAFFTLVYTLAYTCYSSLLDAQMACVTSFG